MKKIFIISSLIFLNLFIFASKSSYRWDEIKRSKFTNLFDQKNPEWATDSLNVTGIGRVPYFVSAYDVFRVDSFAYVSM
ncbi:MAG: hypothetical protein QXG00_07345, partial [Candidatus Woesearchaeota archaeon]